MNAKENTSDQTHPVSEENEPLFPPRPDKVSAALELAANVGNERAYADFLESQCGASDDSQAVEQYDGTLGVSAQFVADHQGAVGQLQWNDNLSSIYTNPGDVSDERWCTGTMITNNLFLTAGHCFDQTGGGWTRPKDNATGNIISPDEIASIMHVNFNYQVDPDGNLRDEQSFPILDLVEYRLGNLDFAIVKLGGNPGAIFGITRVSSTDANPGEDICIIGHPAGVPKRIEAGPVTDLHDNRIGYNDIDTQGGNSGSGILRESDGSIVGVHTHGGCSSTSDPDNDSSHNHGFRITSILANSPTLQILQRTFLENRSYAIEQKSSGRFVDAHESGNDFSVVTRSAQNNNTQKWRLTQVGTVCTIQQLSNGRYVDAYESGNDFSVVTRREQNNDTQRWVISDVWNNFGTCTIQQLVNGRFMDAHQSSGNDFSIVTRSRQNNDTQKWTLTPMGNHVFTVQQKANDRFIDAHESSGNDFSVVTRTQQNNDTQKWVLTPVAGVYEVVQKSSGRFVDAHESSNNDFSVVTRTTQNNDTQKWIFKAVSKEIYTIQQLSSARFVDAHESSNNDFSVVTRSAQNNDTQRWVIKPT